MLASAAAGDEVAFQQIILEHHDDMRRVATYITRDQALADEATQAASSLSGDWSHGNVKGHARVAELIWPLVADMLGIPAGVAAAEDVAASQRAG